MFGIASIKDINAGHAFNTRARAYALNNNCTVTEAREKLSKMDRVNASHAKAKSMAAAVKEKGI